MEIEVEHEISPISRAIAALMRAEDSIARTISISKANRLPDGIDLCILEGDLNAVRAAIHTLQSTAQRKST